MNFKSGFVRILAIPALSMACATTPAAAQSSDAAARPLNTADAIYTSFGNHGLTQYTREELAREVLRLSSFNQVLQAAESGNSSAQVIAGIIYRMGLDGHQQDFAEAVRWYRAACEQGEGEGCAGLGARFINGEGVPQDGAQGVELVRQGCDFGAARSCNTLGTYYADGSHGLDADIVTAVNLYANACDMGVGFACRNMSLNLARGTVSLPSPEETNQMILYGFDRACERRVAAGCVDAGWRYEKGNAVAEDPQQALAYYARGMALGNLDALRLHYNLAYTLSYSATGEPVDIAPYESAAYDMCNQGNGKACTYYGNSLGGRDFREANRAARKNAQATDYRDAKDYFRAACELGDAAGCTELAREEENDAAMARDMEARRERDNACSQINRRVGTWLIQQRTFGDRPQGSGPVELTVEETNAYAAEHGNRDVTAADFPWTAETRALREACGPGFQY